MSDVIDNAEKNLTLILDILKDVYEDCNISDDDFTWFAKQLNEYVFVEKCRLNDILVLAYDFEEYMRSEGVVIDVGRQCAIYDRIIEYLDVNEENSKRLYDSFLEYRDCQAFSCLMNEFSEWLTKEQREEILAIAREEFIESVWEDYV